MFGGSSGSGWPALAIGGAKDATVPPFVCKGPKFLGSACDFFGVKFKKKRYLVNQRTINNLDTNVQIIRDCNIFFH